MKTKEMRVIENEINVGLLVRRKKKSFTPGNRAGYCVTFCERETPGKCPEDGSHRQSACKLLFQCRLLIIIITS